MAHPEIVGMRTSQLPTTFKSDEGTMSFDYSYTNEGYVSKMTVKNGGNTMSYNLTWE